MMAELDVGFIEQFHVLPGETIKQKTQHLFKLFQKYRLHLSKNQDELNEIATNLKATTFLENIFRIDFLIYFKRFKELYQDFLSGDEITLSKVSKQEWFFQEAFGHVSVQEFVTKVLPTVSYAVKLKLLRRLPANEVQNNDIFDALERKYGLSLATLLLHKCTCDKIEEVLKKHLIKLTSAQLKLLYNKNPNLIYLYLEERTRHEGNSDFIHNNPILVHIAQKNPEMFAKLFEKYQFKTQLGRRTTKHYITSQKSNIVDKSEDYIKILKKGPMVRVLGSDLKTLFFNKIPDSYGKLYWTTILPHFPRNRRFTLYRSQYNTTYHHKFGEDVDAIDESVLKIISELNERERIAKLKLQKEGNTKYLQYFSPTYHLGEWKKKLRQMSASERVKFVETATNCVILSRDLDALFQVCEMVAIRCKNDSAEMNEKFLFALILNDRNFLDALEDRHWNLIMEIIAKARSERYYIFAEYILRFKYLEHSIKNGRPILDAVAKCPETLNEIKYEYIWKKPRVCRQILTALVEVGWNNPSDEERAVSYDLELASVCRTFDKRYPKHALKLCNNQRVVHSLEKILRKGKPECYAVPAINYTICQKVPSESVRRLQTLYFEHLQTFGHGPTCVWFLKHDPTTFLEHMDHFVKGFPECENVSSLNHHRFWILVKKCGHLKIDEKILESFKMLLQSEAKASVKKNLIKPLTTVSTRPEDYATWLKSYSPLTERVDLTGDDVKGLYDVQSEFAKCLHHMRRPEAVSILEFCKGDYLQHALGPLCNLIYKLPENEAASVVEKINENQAVSVKKHALHLGCVVLDHVATYRLLQSTSSSLKSAVKYLRRNPTNPNWELVELKLSNAEKTDLQIIKELDNVTLPLKYKSEYVRVAWSVANKYGSKEVQKIVIQQMHKDVVRRLHPRLVCRIVEETLFNIEGTDDFIATLLMDLGDVTLDVFSRVLGEFKKSRWGKKRSARKLLHTFVEHVFKAYMESKDPNSSFVTKFAQIFNSIFEPVEAFQSFVAISFMPLKKKNVKKCGQFLLQFNSDVVAQYSSSSITHLAKVVKELVLPHLFETELEAMQVLHFGFKHKRSIEDYLLVMLLLPSSEPQRVEEALLYQEIVTGLHSTDDVAVNLQFNLYLKALDLMK